MGRSINSGSVNKEYIFSKLSQVTIFSTYFNLPAAIIQHCIDTGELICSPIRNDVHPTFGFRYDNRNKLKAKDFAGYFWGDCFDAVAFVISQSEHKQINIANKSDFIYVLKHIVATHRDIFYGSAKDEVLMQSIRASVENIKKKQPNIELVCRDWYEEDQRYWQQFGVTLQYLNTQFVYPVEQYYIERNINPEPKYYYNQNDPCYAYLLGRKQNSKLDIKLYFPFREHGDTRFICNCNHLEGIYNLFRNDYHYIILTKSTKDRLSIGCTLGMINFIANGSLRVGIINIPHETYKLRKVEYEWLISKLVYNGKLISLMDNDRTGKLEAIWLKREYNITPILIPTCLGCKDFAEFRAKYDIKFIQEKIKETINYLNNGKEGFQYSESSDDSPF